MLPSTMVPDLYKKGKRVVLTHQKTERRLRSMLGLGTREGILAVSEDKKYNLQSQNESISDDDCDQSDIQSPKDESCDETVVNKNGTASYIVWELCTSARSGWVSFPPQISEALEGAYNCGRDNTNFVHDGIPHTAYFAKMKVSRSDWPYVLNSWAWTQKDIRRREWTTAQGCPVDHFDSFGAWLTKPSKYQWTYDVNGVKVYEIHKNIVLNNRGSVEVSKDLREFSFASMQFCRLLNKDPGSVTRVDAIVYEETAVVLRNYHMTRERFASEGKPLNEILVFHGTDETATHKIVAEGFKVGGYDEGVGIKHGRCFGPGVYTAAGPAVPAKYEFGGAGGRVILAKALAGRPAPANMHSPHCSFDSFYPNNESIVFKDGKQLLPLYVVYFHPPSPYDYY
jgi:hypothetical protein